MVKLWHIARRTLQSCELSCRLLQGCWKVDYSRRGSTRRLQKTVSGEWRCVFLGGATHDLPSHGAICIRPLHIDHPGASTGALQKGIPKSNIVSVWVGRAVIDTGICSS